MSLRVSRRKLAAHAADQLVKGVATKKVVKELGAHLVETGRTRELELIVRDIEDALSARGVVIADITSAHPLTAEAKKEVTKLVGAGTLHFREHIDETVLGGVQVNIPGQRFDGTIKRKLTALKAKQL